jgi:hypothetical protein
MKTLLGVALVALVVGTSTGSATQSVAQQQRCRIAQNAVNLDRQRLSSATDPVRRQGYAEQLQQAERDAASICAGGPGTEINVQQRRQYNQCMTLQEMYDGDLRQARNSSATPAQRQHAEQQANQLRQRVAACEPVLKARPY